MKSYMNHTNSQAHTQLHAHTESQKDRDMKRWTQYAYPHQIQRQSTNDGSHPVFNFKETVIDKFPVR